MITCWVTLILHTLDIKRLMAISCRETTISTVQHTMTSIRVQLTILQLSGETRLNTSNGQRNQKPCWINRIQICQNGSQMVRSTSQQTPSIGTSMPAEGMNQLCISTVFTPELREPIPITSSEKKWGN